LHKCFTYQKELAVFGAKSQIWSDRDHHQIEVTQHGTQPKAGWSYYHCSD
jgi:hypothetical protein